jgi:hypothetical protein
MAGELLASLGFTPLEIRNLGGDAAVAAIEAQISSQMEGSDSVPSSSTAQSISQSTITPVSSSSASPVSQANVPTSAGSPNIQQLLAGSNGGITNVTRIKPPDPKFKIGDWVEGTDDMPGQIKSVQWMEQEGLWRYRTVTHFGEDSWAEQQLSSTTAMNIANAPTWGMGGKYATSNEPDEVDLSGSVLGAPLPVSDTGDSGEQGVLEQFLDETSGNRMDVGFGGTGMANGDLLGEGPFTRYLRRRGVGTEGGIGLGSRAGRFVSGQFGDIQDLMEQMEVIRAARGGGTQGPYTGFGLDEFAPIAGDVASRANLGASALQELFGMTQAQREDAGLTFEDTFIDDERLKSTYGLDWLQNLLRSGTRGSAGRIGSKFLAGRLPYMQQQFDLRRGAPGVATNFIDFFKNRFGL